MAQSKVVAPKEDYVMTSTMTFQELADKAGVDVVDLTGDESVADMEATGTILGDELIAELENLEND